MSFASSAAHMMVLRAVCGLPGTHGRWASRHSGSTFGFAHSGRLSTSGLHILSTMTGTDAQMKLYDPVALKRTVLERHQGERFTTLQTQKKSAKSAKDDKHADAEDIDPGTLVAANDADGGVAGLLQDNNNSAKKTKGKKGKKKGKKKKMTKSEKDLAKLEKACDKMRLNKTLFHDFINRMDQWLVNNCKTLIRFYRKLDEDGEGVLTYEDFKSGLFDLEAPCTDVEKHMLSKLLDRENTGDIEFTQFSKGLKYIRELEDLTREEEEAGQVLIKTEREIDHCKCCKMGINGPYMPKYPKYILLELRLVTFNEIKDHSCHIEVLVHAHVPVSSLHQIIIEETGIMSTKLSIFYDKSRSRDAMLPLHLSLQELGYEGGTYDDPDELTLYYDYKVEFTDCPLLLCDHYFGQKTDVNIQKMVMA